MENKNKKGNITNDEERIKYGIENRKKILSKFKKKAKIMVASNNSTNYPCHPSHPSSVFLSPSLGEGCGG